MGITQAGMYPSLVITAQGGLNSFRASDWFQIPGSLFGLVGGTLAQPLLQHRALKTKYETAKVQREQAVLVFRQSVLNALGEVADALVKEDKLKQQQLLISARADTLNRAVTNAQLLFKSDLATYLEIITAQSDALQAELDVANIRKSRMTAVIDLYRSLGGGRD